MRKRRDDANRRARGILSDAEKRQDGIDRRVIPKSGYIPMCPSLRNKRPMFLKPPSQLKLKF